MAKKGDAFSRLADTILNAYFRANPRVAVFLGLHAYDGKLPNMAPSALREEMRRARAFLTRLAAYESLPPRRDLQREMLACLLESALFAVEDLRQPRRNPGIYAFQLSVVPYLSRSYAPLAKRFEAILAHQRRLPRFLDEAEKNLEPSVPAPFVDLGVIASRGVAQSFAQDLPGQAANLPKALRDRVARSTTRTVARIDAFADRLEKKWRPKANQEFPLGTQRYRKMLWTGDRVAMDLEELEALGRENLEGNKAAFLETAKRIDASKTPQEVMRRVSEDHPAAEDLLRETEDLLEELRQFLIDRDLVTVPSEVRAKVTETPRHMRAWATAAMNPPGPFERRGKEAFYYVTPVEPDWPEERAEEWLRHLNYASLTNISVHECYPGHYVHFLHHRRVRSRVAKAFLGYAFTEGWAHYAEEMVIENGLGNGDARLRLAQLQDALLRNCRYLCSLGMHTRGMTLSEATDFFAENAFLERMPAEREAFRGTFDPEYLNYTLGKLLILRARERFFGKHPDASLRAFHDRLLSFGAPPVGLLEDLVLAG
jgi:uncharacterized protein (DUF885 family)